MSTSSDFLPTDWDCDCILSLLLFNPDKNLEVFSFLLSSTEFASTLLQEERKYEMRKKLGEREALKSTIYQALEMLMCARM